MTDLSPGDSVWIKGRMKPSAGGRRLLFSPDGCPDVVLNISCSYPYEDYRGIDPLQHCVGGEPCEVRGVVSARGLSALVLEVWDDDAPGGAGTIRLEPGMELSFGT